MYELKKSRIKKLKFLSIVMIVCGILIAIASVGILSSIISDASSREVKRQIISIVFGLGIAYNGFSTSKKNKKLKANYSSFFDAGKTATIMEIANELNIEESEALEDIKLLVINKKEAKEVKLDDTVKFLSN